LFELNNCFKTVSYNKNSQNNGITADLLRYSSLARALCRWLPKISTIKDADLSALIARMPSAPFPLAAPLAIDANRRKPIPAIHEVSDHIGRGNNREIFVGPIPRLP
jgi:hypothetical protein